MSNMFDNVMNYFPSFSILGTKTDMEFIDTKFTGYGIISGVRIQYFEVASNAKLFVEI